MKDAIDALPYAAAVKIGLQFKRRFWEEDEAIYGGITFTDLPITQISYPSSGYNRPGKGVLLGAYCFGIPATEFTAMTPQERVELAVANGAHIHPQYETEFENGVAVAWHRVPWTLGCFGCGTPRPQSALPGPLCHRRAHRAGGRALLLRQRLAGGRHPLLARRHHALAQTRRGGQLNRCACETRAH